jgi:hypothetical protein
VRVERVVLVGRGDSGWSAQRGGWGFHQLVSSRNYRVKKERQLAIQTQHPAISTKTSSMSRYPTARPEKTPHQRRGVDDRQSMERERRMVPKMKKVRLRRRQRRESLRREGDLIQLMSQRRTKEKGRGTDLGASRSSE